MNNLTEFLERTVEARSAFFAVTSDSVVTTLDTFSSDVITFFRVTITHARFTGASHEKVAHSSVAWSALLTRTSCQVSTNQMPARCLWVKIGDVSFVTHVASRTDADFNRTHNLASPSFWICSIHDDAMKKGSSLVDMETGSNKQTLNVTKNDEEFLAERGSKILSTFLLSQKLASIVSESYFLRNTVVFSARRVLSVKPSFLSQRHDDVMFQILFEVRTTVTH